MYTIVIADDEQLERLALRDALESRFTDMIIVELASNGREALEAVRRTKADIVIMDIEMPGMSGIEASRWIRRTELPCKIVFLTAYSEFDYAKQAVELGAADYLLKPCSDQELFSVIGKVISGIESERREAQRKEITSKRIENLTQRLEEQILLTAMGGYLSAEYLNAQLSELGLAFHSGVFAILRSPELLSTQQIRSMLEGCTWPKDLYLIFLEYDDGLYLFGVSQGESSAEVMLREVITELAGQQAALLGRRLYCGIGKGFTSLEEAQTMFYQAQTAVGHCGPQCPVCSCSIDVAHTRPEVDDVDLTHAICRSVLEGDTENALLMMQTMVENISAKKLSLKAAVERVREHGQRTLEHLQEQTGEDYSKKIDLNTRFSAVIDFTSLIESTQLLVKDLVAASVSNRGGRIAQIRQEISDYLKLNYHRDIFLQDVAREMNYSEAYFSKLFKQCFNQNFINYLTETRIEAAKALLSSPTANIKEVGIQVGYKDSNYFAKVFRRATGKSPSEYRAEMGV